MSPTSCQTAPPRVEAPIVAHIFLGSIDRLTLLDNLNMTKKGLFLSLILIMLVIVIGVAAVVAIRVVDKAQSEPHATCVLFF